MFITPTYVCQFYIRCCGSWNKMLINYFSRNNKIWNQISFINHNKYLCKAWDFQVIGFYLNSAQSFWLSVSFGTVLNLVSHDDQRCGGEQQNKAYQSLCFVLSLLEGHITVQYAQTKCIAPVARGGEML